MKNTFATIKFWMDKILSIACAILLSFMTILVLIQVFTPLCPQQSRSLYRGACPLQPDLDRFHRRGLRLLHP